MAHAVSAAGVVIESHDEWRVTRRYLSEVSIAELRKSSRHYTLPKPSPNRLAFTATHRPHACNYSDPNSTTPRGISPDRLAQEVVRSILHVKHTSGVELEQEHGGIGPAPSAPLSVIVRVLDKRCVIGAAAAEWITAPPFLLRFSPLADRLGHLLVGSHVV